MNGITTFKVTLGKPNGFLAKILPANQDFNRRLRSLHGASLHKKGEKRTEMLHEKESNHELNRSKSLPKSAWRTYEYIMLFYNVQRKENHIINYKKHPATLALLLVYASAYTIPPRFAGWDIGSGEN